MIQKRRKPAHGKLAIGYAAGKAAKRLRRKTAGSWIHV
jgi:hypothetical protein